MSTVLGIAEVTTRPKAEGGYVWSADDKRSWFQRDERRDKTRIYFFAAAESAIENLFPDPRDRSYVEYRKLIPQVLAEVGIRHDTKVHWSQRAGCPCLCSPGFVADVRAGFDVHVTVNQSEDAQSVTFE